MTRTGLSIGLLLASTLAALAAPELLFKHNENGGVVEGSQTKLMEAMRSGRSVKVVYTRSNVSWQRLCLHASVTSASGNESRLLRDHRDSGHDRRSFHEGPDTGYSDGVRDRDLQLERAAAHA